LLAEELVEGAFQLGQQQQMNTNSDDFMGGQTLSGYLEIFRRRKLLILQCVVGIGLASAVFVLRMPDMYKAQTVILVDPQQVPDKYVPATVTANIADRLTTLEQQVLSPTRLKKLVEAQHLYPDPNGKATEEDIIKGVQKSITVDVENPGGAKMGAFKIAFTSRKRELVAPMANQIAQMFIQENQNARVEQTVGTRDFIESQLEETKRELDEKGNQLQAIKTRNMLDLPESKPYHLEALATLRGQIQNIQDKLSQDQREKSILQSVMASGNAAAPTVDVQGDPGAPGASPAQTQVRRLESKLTELRARYGPSHPDVRKTQDELDRAKAEAVIESQNPEMQTSQKPAIASGTLKRHNPVVEAQIEKLDEDIQDREKELGPLQEQVTFHTGKLEQIPVFEEQISGLQRDYDILKTQYTGLLDNKRAAEMSSALEIHEKGERFVVLDSAATPHNPSSPNRLLISIAGLVGGLLAGIGLAVGLEMNDESVRTESEASKILGKPVLSGIPQIISTRERHSSFWRAAGLFVSTVFASAAAGFALSIISGRLL
jgi:polysaccharide biosynthesis transport protein